MSRLVQWIKRKADQNVVTYSRFGLPGEETDERPPPTRIHVAPFSEDFPAHFIFGLHAQRAALVTSGIGMSLTIFIFISVFFEFNWYDQSRGVDILALIGLLLFLVLGLLTHWHVIVGIKKGEARYLLPFITIYTVMIVCEAVLAVAGAYHYLALSSMSFSPRAFHSPAHSAAWAEQHSRLTRSVLIGCALFLGGLILQGAMLLAVLRCRSFLSKQRIHHVEMLVAQKSRSKWPSIEIVHGCSPSPSGGMCAVAGQTIQAQKEPQLQGPTSTDVATGMAGSSAAPPTRTLFQCSEL